MSKVLCFDIGGTSIKYGVFEKSGKLIKLYPSIETNANNNSILDNVLEAIDQTIFEEKIEGVAISSAGVIDSQKGTVIYSGYTIPNYTGTKFKEIITQKYQLNCAVENDVNAACLAEYWNGAGENSNSMVCLTIGTGVGGAVMVEGKLLSGVGFTAGEIGYMPVNGNFFQDVASTSFLVKYVNKLQSEKIYNDGKEIFEGAIKGDEFCMEAIQQQVENLSLGLITIIYLLNPEVIVLGGGIMSQEKYLSPLIKQSVKNKLISPLFEKTQIKFAKNKNQAGMLGALYNYNQNNF